jgi:hypothetical protein
VESNWAFGVKSWIVNVFSCGGYYVVKSNVKKIAPPKINA